LEGGKRLEEKLTEFAKTGQALLTDLVQKLRDAASRYDLCVILLSWSVTYGNDQERVSVFESIKARPGLGKSLGYLVDTQIMVDAVPRRGEKASSGNSNNYNKNVNTDDELVNVIEVLYSRSSHQTGKFGIFDVDADGQLKAVV
jgi:hypothetical protein